MAYTAEYSTKEISETLLQELKNSIKSVRKYGSIEIYIQDGQVTQITTKNIRKTNRK